MVLGYPSIVVMTHLVCQCNLVVSGQPYYCNLSLTTHLSKQLCYCAGWFWALFFFSLTCLVLRLCLNSSCWCHASHNVYLFTLENVIRDTYLIPKTSKFNACAANKLPVFGLKADPSPIYFIDLMHCKNEHLQLVLKSTVTVWD